MKTMMTHTPSKTTTYHHKHSKAKRFSNSVDGWQRVDAQRNKKEVIIYHLEVHCLKQSSISKQEDGKSTKIFPTIHHQFK